MTDIRPFRALRYNPLKTGSISSLITPPYDIINGAMQKSYYQVSPYNIIRLEQGEVLNTDTDLENRYTRAKELFFDWQSDEVLIQEEKPMFYIYRQSFAADGIQYARTGFIAALRAEGYSKANILPHEDTLPKHKADRYKLLEQTNANFSPIFALYADKSRSIDTLLKMIIKTSESIISFTDQDDVLHQIWLIDDIKHIDLIKSTIKQLKIYIADGHHRFETASQYAAERAPSGQYVMTMLVNTYDEGLIIMPTHRLVKSIAPLDKDKLLNGIESKGFFVSKLNLSQTDLVSVIKQSPADMIPFVLYFANCAYLIKISPDIAKKVPLLAEKPVCTRTLNVNILHELILNDLLGIGKEELLKEGYLKYSHNINEAITEVDNKSYQCAFLLGSLPVEQLRVVAESGEKMPQKSTYFYPKICAGLLIHKLD